MLWPLCAFSREKYDIKETHTMSQQLGNFYEKINQLMDLEGKIDQTSSLGPDVIIPI